MGSGCTLRFDCNISKLMRNLFTCLQQFLFPLYCRQHLGEFRDLFAEYMKSKEGR